MTDMKKIYSALKKCNEIGKKLTYDSKYVLYNGIFMAYQDDYDIDDDNIYVANGLSVAFIDSDKIKDNLDAIYYIPLKIDGTTLYRYDKQYKFNRIEIDDIYNTDEPKLHIIFDGTKEVNTVREDYIESTNSSITMDELNSIIDNPANDIREYNKYIKFFKNYRPRIVDTEYSLDIKILTHDNKIIKKVNSIINELSMGVKISEKHLDKVNLKMILDSVEPVIMTMDSYTDNIRLRLMKSLFKGTSASSTAKLIAVHSSMSTGNYIYVIINIVNGDFKISNIYKAINY